jgi:hypothetical protein
MKDRQLFSEIYVVCTDTLYFCALFSRLVYNLNVTWKIWSFRPSYIFISKLLKLFQLIFFYSGVGIKSDLANFFLALLHVKAKYNLL